MKSIKGMICAPFTAFDRDGAVDLAKVGEQSAYYKKNGIAYDESAFKKSCCAHGCEA